MLAPGEGRLVVRRDVPSDREAGVLSVGVADPLDVLEGALRIHSGPNCKCADILWREPGSRWCGKGEDDSQRRKRKGKWLLSGCCDKESMC